MPAWGFASIASSGWGLYPQTPSSWELCPQTPMLGFQNFFFLAPFEIPAYTTFHY